MSTQNEMVVIETEILAEAKRVLKNPRLKKQDILEWAFGEVLPANGAVAISLQAIGCTICTLRANDKRA
jgi:hypothetical protein